MIYNHGCGVLIFVGLRLRGLENLGLQTPTPALKEAGLRLQLQNVMCDMLIVYFMMNGQNLILLIRCTTDGAASIALDLNDTHMSR